MCTWTGAAGAGAGAGAGADADAGVGVGVGVSAGGAASAAGTVGGLVRSSNRTLTLLDLGCNAIGARGIAKLGNFASSVGYVSIALYCINIVLYASPISCLVETQETVIWGGIGGPECCTPSSAVPLRHLTLALFTPSFKSATFPVSYFVVVLLFLLLQRGAPRSTKAARESWHRHLQHSHGARTLEGLNSEEYTDTSIASARWCRVRVREGVCEGEWRTFIDTFEKNRLEVA